MDDKKEDASKINWRRINRLRKLSKNTTPKKEKIRRKTSFIQSSSPLETRRNLTFKCLSAILTCFVVFIVIVYNRPNFETEVIKIINEHTDDTCHNPFDGSTIVRGLRHQVLHQDFALSDIERLLRNHRDISAMSIIGPTGTGKSMSTAIMQEYFPWSNNVIHLLWPTMFPGASSRLPATKASIYDSVLWQLSSCGHNLLVIDNISPGSVSQIAAFHRTLLDYLVEERMKAIVVFVFTVPTFLDDQLLNLEKVVQQVAMQNNANDIEPILYRSITEPQQVRLCVEMAKSQLGLSQVSSEQIDEIVASIDAPRSGCKPVYAKTALYA